MKRKVGIQIGETSIKIVELEKKHTWEIKKSIQKELDEGIVKEGNILQPNKLGLKLHELLSAHNIKRKKVNVFIEELPFFVRTVEIPTMPKHEKEQAIKYQLQLHLPVDINDLTFRYTQPNNKKEQYIVFAVYTAAITKVVETLDVAGLTLEHFNVEPIALMTGLLAKDNVFHCDDTIMVIRTDTMRMMIAIYIAGNLVSARYVPISNQQEIERTIISWNDTNAQPINKVVLLGDTIDWQTIKKQLEKQYSLKVEQFLAPFTACLGVALTDNGFPIRHRKRSDKALPLQAAVLIVCTFIILTAFLLLRPVYLKNDIDKLQQKLAESENIIALLAHEEDLRRQIADYQNRKGELASLHIDVLPTLHKLASFMDDSTTLQNISISTSAITLEGIAKEQASVLAFYQNLETNYPNVQLVHANEGQTAIQFTIEILLRNERK